MTDSARLLEEMNTRSREVFRRVVEGYLETGDPVGSRTLTRSLSEQVSAATIRNVMQDLELLGLLDSPHVSAGRIPTQMGLRMFVDSMIELGDPSEMDREKIDATMGSNAYIPSKRTACTIGSAWRTAVMVTEKSADAASTPPDANPPFTMF